MGKRFETTFTINQPEEFVQFILNDFFAKEGFTLTDYNGERVWKKGVGMLTAPQFIKVDYQNGQVHLEAWMKYAILPGVYCGEMGLTGFWGFAVKKVLRDRVDALIYLLQQPVAQSGQPMPHANPAQAAPSAQPGQPAQQTPYAQPQPIPVAVHDTSKKATLALVMGLISIVAWIIPLAGVIVSVIGITSAIPGMKSSGRGKAIAGLVLSIIFLIVSIVCWILNFAATMASL